MNDEIEITFDEEDDLSSPRGPKQRHANYWMITNKI